MRMRSKHERGQTMVEFALIIPVFILIVMGLFDVGRAIYAYNTVSNAARSAARVAIVDQDVATVKNAAIQDGVGLGLSASDVTFTSCSDQYCELEVTVTWDYTPITPMIGAVFDPTISSTARMPVEVVNP